VRGFPPLGVRGHGEKLVYISNQFFPIIISMKAIYLVRTGKAENAFEFRETAIPTSKPNEVLIRVQAFGLNFADIVAREGMYRDAPPRPFIPGYDVVGIVERTGSEVKHLQAGDRVIAMTRFGGYAEYAVTDGRACVKIPADVNPAVACALTTQFCTAYYCAAVASSVTENEKVIVHSAASGVGMALLQYCRYKKCVIIGTTGSENKREMILQMGASHVINTSTENFKDRVRSIFSNGTDVIFDAMGGKFVRQGISLLAAGGRLVCYGASQMTGVDFISRMKAALQFGIYHPAQFMMTSKSLLGVNMLKIADERPLVLQHCLEQVMKLYQDGIFKPAEGKIFRAEEIADAHRFLEKRMSTGKVAIVW
jgi:NADPH:quinone reductase-like Zn-dependent oxidoreductase